MYLHNNEKEFDQAIRLAGKVLDIDFALIEKDYYVCILLKLINQKYFEKTGYHVVFKGGTSLSKCYKVINRFSEDIDISSTPELDINLDKSYKDKTVGRSNLERFNKSIKEATEALNFIPYKDLNFWTKMPFVNFKYNYKHLFESKSLKEYIEIDSVNYLSCYNLKKGYVSTLIYDAIMKSNDDLSESEIQEYIKKYELEPFEIYVQSLERTFIDKTFAICDYYMKNSKKLNARHIYDLYKLYPKVDFDKIKELIPIVREDRAKFEEDDIHFNPSSQKGVNVNEILEEIKVSDNFKMDYENNTKKLMYAGESIPFEEVIKVLDEIIKLEIF